jgi:hypothetical protein
MIPSKHHPQAQRDVDKAVDKLIGIVKKRVNDRRFTPQVDVRLSFEIPDEATRLSPVSEHVLTYLWRRFPPVQEDRVFSKQLRILAMEIEAGVLTKEAEIILPFDEVVTW